MTRYLIPPAAPSGWRSGYVVSPHVPATPHQQAGETLPDRSVSPVPRATTASIDTAMFDATEAQMVDSTWTATPSSEYEERLHATDPRPVRNLPYEKYPKTRSRLILPPESEIERMQYLATMRKNWGCGWFMTLGDMVGEECFGEEVSRELFEALARLSAVPGAEGSDGRGRAKNVLEGVVGDRDCTILTAGDVEIAVMLLAKVVE
ncbi:hypothetical protein LTR78_003857 [Recurvomyces mirabilis]|uniref:Uncharacterized protein n=1 Tax=Recurvomyces mirabilis TaxID=574656 RepID=A0AAE1C358_9PEZI|nr:hypothetical protein LTR78_003857 [Recurvomyces mirabilis]KAK5154004.1 hypothetical protein LTS14_007224 [Recurvomyces mirabilis]